MRLSVLFGLRYLFSRSSINAINWVSGISALAIGIVSMALVCVLSVYNGYVQLILEGTEHTDPDLLIRPAQGQTLSLTRDPRISQALAQPQVKGHGAVLRSKGLLSSGARQWVVEVVGIAPGYLEVVDLSEGLSHGQFDWLIGSEAKVNVPLCFGAYLLFGGADVEDEEELQLVFPRRKGLINPLSPASAFVREPARVMAGLKPLREDIDHTIYLPLERLQRMLAYDADEASAIALSLEEGASLEQTKRSLSELLGTDYRVLDRAEQHPELSYLIRMEKVITYAVLLFILLLAASNMASSLAMLVIEKRGDIATLYALGASASQVAGIFRSTGLLISLSGTLLGTLLGLLLCWIQLEWEPLMSGTGLGMMPFPIQVQLEDILLILLASVVVSLLISSFPVRLTRRSV
ncbi:FtsX-like permease family protein [Porphyromonas sp. COT-239 OH1446]|uniref:FtsX-like permease family protein n=1 Tax=Porphyromonas sp. COT-239 OH1446 TaxID=1515613 RepID=UPI00052C0585|nr:FtsX-like permease family protein [Porphyromonas sp. COT-239 OH1446]KGN71506.1 hypothetical protein HQ37_01675 [Porphyromonas sp. COT-239 OH1446]